MNNYRRRSPICFIIICFLFLQTNSQAQFITTIAGMGGNFGRSGDNGLATKAQLYNPRGIALTPTGDLIIADMGNDVIRKVDKNTGIISLIAGSGCGSSMGDGGKALQACFDGPTGVMVDYNGNIYVVEQYAYVVRKIDAVTGVISTFAGFANSQGGGGDGGKATNARFSYPTGGNVDKNGNVYIADWDNSVIRKVDVATNIINRVAGITYSQSYSGDNGLATNASINCAPRVFIDPNGNIFIPDQLNNRIRKVDGITGIITTVAGNGTGGYNGDGGAAINAQLNKPAAVTIDKDGNIYIADTYNNAIRKVDAITGIISTIAGTGNAGFFGDGGLAKQAMLNFPTDILIDGNGDIIIADAKNQVIRKISNCQKQQRLRNDTAICSNTNIALTSGVTNGTWKSYDDNIATVSNGNVQGIKGGVVKISYSYMNQACMVEDTVLIKVNDVKSIKLGNDTAVCQNPALILDAGTGFSNYLWNDGAITQKVKVTKAGQYSVTATDGNKCQSTSSIFIKEFNVFRVILPDDPHLCDGKVISLKAPADIVHMVWQDGSTSDPYVIKNGGTYWVTATSNKGCVASDTFVVTKVFKPVIFPTKDFTICQYDTIQLSPAGNYDKYNWSTGSTDKSIVIKQGGAYKVDVTDQYACVWSDAVNVIQKNDCILEIYFPNAFTPNMDGKNDVFRPGVYGRLDAFHIIIYNRWGGKVYESNDWKKGWDGNFNGALQPQGSYVWVATYKQPGKEQKTENGTLVLIR